jgi:plasmid stability protein
MAVNLSIKAVPDELADTLRRRAAQNHRSLQGELMHILQAAVAEPRPFPAKELAKRIKALGFTSPDEGTAIVRAARDRR